MGYHRAGFEVVGVDINPQKNYPFEFHQADALTYPLDGFDVIHASPPCQAYSRASSQYKNYPDLVSKTREKLTRSNRTYVIENVVGAPLIKQYLLCGSMFKLEVMRHRFFESNVFLLTPQCNHGFWKNRYPTLDNKRRKKTHSKIVGVYGSTQYSGDFENRCMAMGIDWMVNEELTQAIPPAYTEWIGKQLKMF